MKRFINYSNLIKYNCMENIKFLRTIRNLGGSLIITIDKDISDLLHIKKDDMLELIITKKIIDNNIQTEFQYRKTIKKVKIQGGSFFITLDIGLIKLLDVKTNDLVDIEILQKINNTNRLLEYKCKTCEYRFIQDNEHPFCPNCNSENLQILEIENKIN
jgi:Zn finger protein HypA/HybF involved in hydrogenase expression